MSKVVFLLGAGASAHLDFPTGAGLQGRIIRDQNESVEVRELLHAQFDSNKVEEFYSRLRSIDVDSIDEFLAVQVDEDLQSIGRFLIAHYIGRAEHHALSVNTTVSADWYRIFRRYLFSRPQLVDSSRFSFITFNYDRSFEHYLFKSLQADPRFTPKQIIDFLGPKNLLHVHGSLGECVETPQAEKFEYGILGPLSGRGESGGILKFDGSRVPERLQQLSKASGGLFLTHSQIRRDAEVKTLISAATHLVVLGFGFHRTNCEKALLHEFSGDILASIGELSPSAQLYISKLTKLQGYQLQAHGLFSNHVLRMMDQVFSISPEA